MKFLTLKDTKFCCADHDIRWDRYGLNDENIRVMCRKCGRLGRVVEIPLHKFGQKRDPLRLEMAQTKAIQLWNEGFS